MRVAVGEDRQAKMSAMKELLETMARLRSPEGCPWDREQTHQSLARCLVEETAELLEAIDRDDKRNMREELGDVLLQVVFHARIAEESGDFSFEEVAAEINEKLIRRHPHVFGSATAKDSEEVYRQWDQIKAVEAEKRDEKPKLFGDLPKALPALLHAWALARKIQKNDLLDSIPDREKVEELSKEIDEQAAGERLFEIAAASRLAGIDPESALRRYSQNLKE